MDPLFDLSTFRVLVLDCVKGRMADHDDLTGLLLGPVTNNVRGHRALAGEVPVGDFWACELLVNKSGALFACPLFAINRDNLRGISESCNFTDSSATRWLGRYTPAGFHGFWGRSEFKVLPARHLRRRRASEFTEKSLEIPDIFSFS